MTHNDIKEISAEMLLNLLYPEIADNWLASCEGSFYRNYTGDCIAIYEDSSEVLLSRDGFLKMLPEGLLSDENELKVGGTAELQQKKEQRMRVLREAFMPLDTMTFRQRLKIESVTSELLNEKLSTVLKTIFGYDIESETNPYIREVARLLPFVSKLRADFSSIAKLLGTLFGCLTKMKIDRYSETDNTRCWIPSVEYQLLKPNLSADEYRSLVADIEPLRDFIAEWFIPAEMRCRISVKHHRQPQRVGEKLVLDYNSEL